MANNQPDQSVRWLINYLNNKPIKIKKSKQHQQNANIK